MEAIVEIPAGSLYKYEMKKGELFIDRVLNQECPYNYGFFEFTMCGDGDPLDVFILSTRPIPSRTKVKVSIVSGLCCMDNGLADDKLIGILEGEEHFFTEYYYKHVDRIKNYLTTYKTGFEILRDYNVGEAYTCYNESKIYG